MAATIVTDFADGDLGESVALAMDDDASEWIEIEFAE
jgi:hypothetical protein